MAKSLDKELVEHLYRAYGAQVMRCCLRILHDAEEAAEAAHEVFLNVITSGGDFRGESRWTTYLFKMAKNECLSRLNKAENRRELLAQYGGDPVRPGAMFDPAVLLDLDILRALLGAEDDKTKSMVVYYYLFEMSLREVGEQMGMSHTAVRQCLDKFERRAQANLRKMTKKLA